MRIYLPIITLLIFGISFIWSSVRVYRLTGINPMRFGKEDNAHNYIGMVMKVIIGMLLIAVFLYAFNWNYQYLLPMWYLESQTLDVTGLILLHISLIWIVYAQISMGKSWRIGLDTENKTQLVTSGIFSLSRNPIFLGMMSCILAIFLIIPNLLTFCVLLLSYFVIQIQVRMEEEFLTMQHGSSYLSYKNSVRRWL
jgi:protein-S-isoprenylcysteine O-methyltransferase Ste14